MMGVARPVPRFKALPPNTWWWVLAGVVMLPAAAPLGVLAYGLVSGVVTTVPVGRLLELAANTGALSAAVTLTSSLIGGASAWLVSRTDLPGKRIATVLIIIPFAVPSFVGALALLGATGADGVLSAVSTWMGGDIIRYPSGFWAAWLVLTLISVPLVHLAIAPAMGSLNPTLEEAARGLGAGRMKVFWTITLPQLRPSLTAGAMLVGLYTLSDFGAVSLLRYDTFTRAIYLEYAGRVDRRPALGLAAVLAAAALLVVWIERSTRARGVWFTAKPRRTAPPVRLGPLGRVIGWGFLGSLVTLSLLVPIVVLSAWMMRGLISGVLADAPWAEMGRSIWVAVLTAVAAAVFGYPGGDGDHPLSQPLGGPFGRRCLVALRRAAHSRGDGDDRLLAPAGPAPLSNPGALDRRIRDHVPAPDPRTQPGFIGKGFSLHGRSLSEFG